MNIILIKMVVTPVLMLAICLAMRRWGSFIGGILSGLPLTSGPIVIFLTIEQGRHFATQSASGALSGLSAVLLTYLFYLVISRFIPVLFTCLMAIIFFALMSSLLLMVSSPAIAIIISMAAIMLMVYFTRQQDASEIKTPKASVWDIPFRMLTSTVMLFVITSSAHILGPQISGILAPIPVIAWPLTVFAHVHSGRNAMLAVMRGNAISAIGVIIFYEIVRVLLPSAGLFSTFALALISAVVVTSLLAGIIHRTTRALA